MTQNPNIKVNQIHMGTTVLDEIIDEDGEKWYPLASFFSNVLLRPISEKIVMRDSNMSRYMKVITYEPQRNGGYRPIPTWCMNEKGMKFILKHMTTYMRGDRNKALLRQKRLKEAQNYFKVKPLKENEPIFIQEMPDLDNYDIWSYTCISNDLSIKYDTIWRKCSKCGYYYPNTYKYFPIDHKTRNCISSCKQCNNKDFVCDNQVLQFFYEHSGINLIYALYLNDDKRILDELSNLIAQGVEVKK